MHQTILSPKSLYAVNFVLTADTPVKNNQDFAGIVAVGAVSLASPNIPPFYLECHKSPFVRFEPETLSKSFFEAWEVQSPSQSQHGPDELIQALLGWTTILPEGRIPVTRSSIEWTVLEIEAARYGITLPVPDSRIVDFHSIACVAALLNDWEVPLAKDDTSPLRVDVIGSYVGVEIPKRPRLRNGIAARKKQNALINAVYQAEITHRLLTNDTPLFPDYGQRIRQIEYNFDEIQKNSLFYSNFYQK